jgi:hypothetical protein
MDASLVQKRAITAAEIDQPELPTFCTLMMAWRHEMFGESNRIVFFADRPMEQLPWIKTLSRPGASSQATFSLLNSARTSELIALSYIVRRGQDRQGKLPCVADNFVLYGALFGTKLTA